jgi:hypothetical protein
LDEELPELLLDEEFEYDELRELEELEELLEPLEDDDLAQVMSTCAERKKQTRMRPKNLLPIKTPLLLWLRITRQ